MSFKTPACATSSEVVLDGKVQLPFFSDCCLLQRLHGRASYTYIILRNFTYWAISAVACVEKHQGALTSL